ncbi:MAG TPA: hypothetical protein VNV66_10270 [Pilimelia sp.]|nr:hypothetical protein [Pilimelia sp.]
MSPAPLRERLRKALPAAMRARDRAAVSALRSALAAIDNAEAVDRPTSADHGLAIGETPRGAGAADVARRTLSDADVERIVRMQVAESRAAAATYERAGETARAEIMRAQAAALETHLTG